MKKVICFILITILLLFSLGGCNENKLDVSDLSNVQNNTENDILDTQPVQIEDEEKTDDIVETDNKPEPEIMGCEEYFSIEREAFYSFDYYDNNKFYTFANAEGIEGIYLFQKSNAIPNSEKLLYNQQPFSTFNRGKDRLFILIEDDTKLISIDFSGNDETVIFKSARGDYIDFFSVYYEFVAFRSGNTIYRLYLPTGDLEEWVSDDEMRIKLKYYGYPYPFKVFSNTDVAWLIPPKDPNENYGLYNYRAYSQITNKKYMIDGILMDYGFRELQAGYLAVRGNDIEEMGLDPHEVSLFRFPEDDTSNLAKEMQEAMQLPGVISNPEPWPR